MVTNKEANQAREQYSDKLQELGAHAINVDQIDDKNGNKTFGVIAFYEEMPEQSLPETLEIESKGKKKQIPLRAKITPMATLE